MTKDVLVSITGAHTLGRESDDISVITAGSYYLKNGRHYIIYDETLDEPAGTVRNTIKISKGMIDIIKGGDVRSHMVFEENKTNINCYVTPFGQMMVGVATERIEIEEQPDRLTAGIDYTLEFNYEKMSRCHIKIEISSRASARLHLSGPQEQ